MLYLIKLRPPYQTKTEKRGKKGGKIIEKENIVSAASAFRQALVTLAKRNGQTQYISLQSSCREC